ncbi:hypothetical protein THRCLA_09046 [Thraustotheca clavata]|uniref:Phosphatidylinositol N-acetylglucosaminyltransferase subunit H conserved domain-containing protein n=1 Tax=Thraustotheca clavata TaxID=74557 RepID=A0A1V9YZX9_9STRA|nr:hypothetical protein THRCLA_09046 [Thraustotheca clavata]
MELRINNFGTDAREYTLCDGRRGESNVFMSVLRLISFILLGITCYGMIMRYILKKASFANEFVFGLIGLYLMTSILKSIYGGKIVEESVLVIPQIGVQLRKKQQNGNEKFMFLEAKCINAVVINEAITFADVIYYMAFLVQNESKMILAFETFRPRVNALEKIFLGTKALLFPDDSKMTTI